jgi:hypothetical protein
MNLRNGGSFPDGEAFIAAPNGGLLLAPNSRHSPPAPAVFHAGMRCSLLDVTAITFGAVGVQVFGRLPCVGPLVRNPRDCGMFRAPICCLAWERTECRPVLTLGALPPWVCSYWELKIE